MVKMSKPREMGPLTGISMASDLNTDDLEEDMIMKKLTINPTDFLNEQLSQESLREVTIVNENTGKEERSHFKQVEVKESFHTAIGSILTTAQVFGLMPIRGVLAQSPNQLRFKYLSFRVAYTSIFLFCLSILTLLSMKDSWNYIEQMRHQFLRNFRETVCGLLFYGHAFIASILFLRLSSKWPNMMAKWHYVEQILRQLPFRLLSKKFRLITVAIMVSALCEHILNFLYTIPEYINPSQAFMEKPPCLMDYTFKPDVKNFKANELLKVHICRSHYFIFSSIHYNTCLGILMFVGSRLAIFIWNFTDLFIILISIGLSERFVQFNQRIKKVNQKVIGNKEWQDLREHYNMLSNLVKAVDSEVSGLILLSFASNLSLICVQLSKSIDSEQTLAKMYFFGSFLFILGRTILVILNGAQIQQESKDPLIDIFQSSSENYCIEMIRLQNQISTDNIELTGKGIFSITRSFVLVVAGCIFTYEVVLLQFYIALKENLAIAPPNITDSTTLTTLAVIN